MGKPAKKKAQALNGNGYAGSSPSEGLQWMLGPTVSVDKFRQDFYEKNPLHVKRGKEGASYWHPFAHLATPEALFSMLDSGEVAVHRLNMFRCRDGSNKETPQPPPSTAQEVRRLFSEGWSIQWLQPQQESGPLANLVSILESQFGSLVGVNAYLTPAKTQGLAPHWDDVDVFVLQLHGQKSWSLHRSSAAIPLPAEAQSLHRYGSGDLPLDSLSEAILTPTVEAGDLLYFPRGMIHYAPNQGSDLPSVHLTASTLQKQSVFDLLMKTFEEAMANRWQKNEDLRKSIPWLSLSPGSQAYPSLCQTVSKELATLTKTLEDEAKRAEAAQGNPRVEGSFVAAALREINADFIRNRMPPRLQGSSDEEEEGSVVSPTSWVVLPDSSVLNLVASTEMGETYWRLVTCINNSQLDHMMMRNPMGMMGQEAFGDDGDDDEEGEEEEPRIGDKAAAKAEAGKEKEEDKTKAEHKDEPQQEEDGEGEGEGAEGDESEDEDEDMMMPGGGHQAVPGMAIDTQAVPVLFELCNRSPRLAMASKASNLAKHAVEVNELLKKASVPSESIPSVCSLLTQLAAQGILQVVEANDADAGKNGKKRKKGGGGLAGSAGIGASVPASSAANFKLPSAKKRKQR